MDDLETRRREKARRQAAADRAKLVRDGVPAKQSDSDEWNGLQNPNVPQDRK